MRDPLLFLGSAVGLSPKVRDSMVFLMVDPFGKDMLAQGQHFHYTVGQDRIAGNMLGGTAEAVRRWAELYYQVLEEYVDRQWLVGKD
jgi:hypothetical protein